MNKTHSYRMGVSLVVAAAFGWSALGSLILLLPSLSPLAVSSVRGFCIALAFGVMALREKRRLSLSRGVLLAGLAYALSALTYITSLTLIPVAVAAPLHYTTPAFLLIGSMLLLARSPSRNDLYGIVFSLSGSLILVLADTLSSWLGVTYALLSALLWALYLALQGSFSREEKISAAFVAGVCLSLAGGWDLNITSWSAGTWGLLFIMGAFSSILPLLFLARASTIVAPTSASLILLLEPVFAAMLAFLINNQVPSVRELIGIAVILVGAVYGMGLAKPRVRVSGAVKI